MVSKPTRVWTGTGWAQISIPSGAPGKSAYELAVDNGYVGTYDQWYASLIGEKGDTGPQGPQGPQGDRGVSVPTGGTAGQVLVKNSSADYDFTWRSVPGIDGGAGVAPTSGIIIPDGQITGGIKTSYTNANSGYTYNVHKFLYAGPSVTQSLVVNEAVIGKLLVVGGGGQGGSNNNFGDNGGTGGGGAVYYADYAFGVGTHNLIVGGDSTEAFLVNRHSSFDGITCYAGGRGGDWYDQAGFSGGSGGGGGKSYYGAGAAGGTGTGGTGGTPSNFYYSNGNFAGRGGSSNIFVDWLGTNQEYGYGGYYSTPTANTGGGGNFALGHGAAGIVMVRYRIA